MPSEKIGSIKATTITKVLPANGLNPRFEVSAPNGSGSLAGENVQMMATYSSEVREDEGAAFKGVVYFQTAAPSLASLNGTAVVYNSDVD
jgi:hypothetical protein